MASYTTNVSNDKEHGVGVLVIAVSVPEDVLLEVRFSDVVFTYHAQWLHDARARDDGNASRSAEDAFPVHAPDARILKAAREGSGAVAVVVVSWADGTTTSFPGAWLRVFGPLVAKPSADADADNGNGKVDVLAGNQHHGWTLDTIEIPTVDYNSIFPQAEPSLEKREAISIKFTDMLFHEGKSGIIKVVNLPPPDLVSERDRKNTLVTKILKHVFGSVFAHPRRAPDSTFNISTDYGEDKLRGVELHNYRTDVLLLPHCDHAHYEHPARVQGLYCLEGESYNTFVSSVAVLETMRQEDPHLYPYMLKSPMVVGRVAHFYDPPMFQATVESPVTMMPGFPDQVKRIRWHPHLAGVLVAPFHDFVAAREAYQKFQAISRRPSHQLTVHFRPGDLYIWDNFRTLHGRENIISAPRTSVGNTVPEHIVSERYRSLQIKRLRHLVDEAWFVHIPTPQLYYVAKLLDISVAGSREDVNVPALTVKTVEVQALGKT